MRLSCICFYVILSWGCAFAQLPNPDPIRNIEFRKGDISVNLSSFTSGTREMKISKSQESLIFEIEELKYNCPEDLSTRIVHMKGSISISSYNNGKPIQYNLLWNKKADGSITAELQPINKIADFIKFVQNSTQLMHPVILLDKLVGYEWNWDEQFTREFLFEASSEKSLLVEYQVLSLFKLLRTDIINFNARQIFPRCEEGAVIDPHASASVKCGAETWDLSTGSSGGSCTAIDNIGACCVDQDTGTACRDCVLGHSTSTGSGSVTIH